MRLSCLCSRRRLPTWLLLAVLFWKRYVFFLFASFLLSKVPGATYTNIREQTLKQGFESIGFTPTVQPLKEFEDDYGLKLGDEDEEEGEEEEEDDDESGSEEEDSDEDDE